MDVQPAMVEGEEEGVEGVALVLKVPAVVTMTVLDTLLFALNTDIASVHITR